MSVKKCIVKTLRGLDKLLGVAPSKIVKGVWSTVDTNFSAVTKIDEAFLTHVGIHWRTSIETIPPEVGVLLAENVKVLSISASNEGEEEGEEEDQHARFVYLTTRTYRPILNSRDYAYFPEMVKGLWRRLKTKEDIREGRVVLLGGFNLDCDNYFHFWMDAILDFLFIKKTVGFNSETDKILLPYSGNKWQKEILGLCGIDEKSLIPFSSFNHLVADQLITAVRAKGSKNIPALAVSWLREVSGFVMPEKKPFRKIYVSRGDTPRRQVSNEKDLESYLVGLGFELIVCSKLTVKEQQQTFAESSIVVASHGAALTNLAWCAEETKVIELVSEDHANPCFMCLAQQSNLDYHAIQCKSSEPSGNGLMSNIHVPISVFEGLL